MYYIIYGPLYLLSLLPFPVLYLLGDFIYVLLYYIAGYRKAVVMNNLSIAFPGKTEAEKKAIARQFYKNFADTFVEIIKMMSMSEKAFDKRVTIDIAAANELIAKGKNIQFHPGHQMNWEYANWAFAKHLNTTWIGIYQHISSRAFGKIMYRLRVRFGGKMVSTREFKTVAHNLFKQQYAIGLVADQNTHSPAAYWMYFFSKPVPFIPGPDRGALKNNTAVAFVNFVKTKRGYYHYETSIIAESTEHFKPGELTRMYRDYLEACIQKEPSNYLWTHRRWRHTYNKDARQLWMDTKPEPVN